MIQLSNEHRKTLKLSEYKNLLIAIAWVIIDEMKLFKIFHNSYL